MMPGQRPGLGYHEQARVLGIPLQPAQCVGSLSVYLPRHFAARDATEVAAFVDSAGAADLVTFDGTRPVASLIPVIWERPGAGDGAPEGANGAPAGAEGAPEGAYGRLLGHLALANPQWR